MSTQGYFSDFYEHINRTLKQKGCVEKILNDFAKLTSDSKRFDFVSNLMSKYEFHIACLEETIIWKCPNESIRLRNEGNEAFIKGNDGRALFLYSRSAMSAPTDTELSLAYANKSAVLAAKKILRDSVTYIEMAINLNYPEHLKFKLIKRKGDCLCQLGNHSQGRESYKYSLSLLNSATNLSESKKKEIELKLLESLKECCSHSDVQKPDEENTACLPTFSENKEVPCASEGIKISYDEIMGRHIVATRYIDPGEVIAVEEPFASILSPDCYLSHCYHCLRRCWILIPCRKCCHVMFCSEKCRSMSWNEYHEKECSILPFILKLNMGRTAHLAVRIVLSLEFTSLKNLIDSINLNFYSKCPREKGFSENGKYISSDYTPIYHLEGHTDKRSVSDLFKQACMSHCIVSCLKYHTTLFSIGDNTSEVEMAVGELILRHMQNLPCNAHVISEILVSELLVVVVKPDNITDASLDNAEPELATTLLEIGEAAYAMLSLINHSCDPNVVRNYCNGGTAILRAIRPIQEGEQLFDSYGCDYGVYSVKKRKDNLREKYFFDCACTPCSELWPAYPLMNDNNIGKRFRCPNCRFGPLEKADSVENELVREKSELFFCKKCKKSVDITESTEKLAASTEEFYNAVHKFLSDLKIDKTKLLGHLLLMDKTLVRPWKEYYECQEAIKHVFALEGNCFKV